MPCAAPSRSSVRRRAARAPDVVLFGLTAWARAKDLPTQVQAALEALVERLPGIVRDGAAAGAVIAGGVEVLLLDNAQEALLECSAVRYAAQRSGTAAPSCVLGSGGGSVQFTLHGVPSDTGDDKEDEAHYLPLGFREGKALVLTQGVEGLRTWEARVRSDLGAHAVRHGPARPERILEEILGGVGHQE